MDETGDTNEAKGKRAASEDRDGQPPSKQQKTDNVHGLSDAPPDGDTSERTATDAHDDNQGPQPESTPQEPVTFSFRANSTTISGRLPSSQFLELLRRFGDCLPEGSDPDVTLIIEPADEAHADMGRDDSLASAPNTAHPQPGVHTTCDKCNGIDHVAKDCTRGPA